MTFCLNNNFCCSSPDQNNAAFPTCCDGETFPLSMRLSLQATSISSATQSTSAQTQSPAMQPASSSTQITSPAASCSATGASSSKNKNVTVGASVGVVLGSMLLAALATIFFLWRKLGQARREYQHNGRGAVAGKITAVQHGQLHETDGQQYQRHELPSLST